MANLRIVPWGFSSRSRSRGLRHFRVVEEIKPGAWESLCHHSTRAQAERCIEHRKAAEGARCSDYAPPKPFPPVDMVGIAKSVLGVKS